ncbi:MAG TPA: carbohydrate-binding family 9-like protein [Segetibacter sp.]
MRYYLSMSVFFALLCSCSTRRQMNSKLSKATQSISELGVIQTNDFMINGKGDNAAWDKAKWNNMVKLDTGGRGYESKFKILYSTTGIYILFSGEDDKISTKEYNDFEQIYNGDVFEVFFLPTRQTPVYFEYEINQMRKELILTLSKTSSELYAWAPKYPSVEERKPIKKQVNVTGGKAEVGGLIKAWTAEVFLPYTILSLLPGVPPASGTVWNANFCRIDYDSGKMIKYSWTPTIQKSFHEIEKYQTIRFE